jgi:hypothetical protein
VQSAKGIYTRPRFKLSSEGAATLRILLTQNSYQPQLGFELGSLDSEASALTTEPLALACVKDSIQTKLHIRLRPQS